MRLRITLRPLQRNCSIPLNYSYYLSTVIYHWIEISSKEYADFLHNNGYTIDGTVKRFKHFCFSQLVVPQRRIINGRLIIESPRIDWYVSMPVEKSLEHLVIGIFEKKELYIEQKECRFVVDQVEILPEPSWTRQMKFRMMSPTTASTQDVHNGSLGIHYLTQDDNRIESALQKNIINKYISLYGQPPEDTEFRCTFDEKFIENMSRKGKKITKLITIKEGHEEESKVRGFLCPVTIEGNPQLIKLAYESGLGEKNSMGFGMLEILNDKWQ